MKLKKILGIISNIVSLVFVTPFSFYFGVLGLLLLSSTDFTWSFLCIIQTISSALFICAPLSCILGIILSVIFRKKGNYKNSYLIQLLPFMLVLLGIFVMVTTMIFGNP